MERMIVALVCAQTLVVAAAAGAAVSAPASSLACLPSGVKVDGAVPSRLRLDAEQQANAKLVVQAVVARRLPSRAAVIAVATALQESGLRNLPYGGRDSLGLFQQRPSQGWGGRSKVMDPVAATNSFLARLDDVPSWPVLPLTVAAQSVQRSAYPEAYARWEPFAIDVVAGLLGRPSPPQRAESVATDAPGLFVLADGPLAPFATGWPRRFHGGAVAVEADPSRNARQGLALLAQMGDNLPDTVVISLGKKQTKRVGAKREAKTKTVSRVMDAAVAARALAALGERTVYWVDHDSKTSALLEGLTDRHQVLRVAGRAEADKTASSSVRDDSRASAITASVVSAVTAAEREAEADSGPCADEMAGLGKVPVGDCALSAARANPRSCPDAVRWALAQSDGAPSWERKCLHFVARAHGWSASGVRSAAAYWSTAADRHIGDTNPPPGALVFWDTGHRDGHVALSAGNGTVVSTDIAGAGTVAAVALTTVTERWNATYLGWTPPNFPQGV
ncbi:MAG: hypothetical protein ACT4QF_05055 [Sporichthyaceae bacterium]